MKQSDFDNPDIMRKHAESLHGKAYVGKELLLCLNIQLSDADRVLFKGVVQVLNSIVDELTFDDNSTTK